MPLTIYDDFPGISDFSEFKKQVKSRRFTVNVSVPNSDVTHIYNLMGTPGSVPASTQFLAQLMSLCDHSLSSVNPSVCLSVCLSVFKHLSVNLGGQI